MRRHYPAIVHGGDGEAWGLSFVDLPVHVGGKTLEALRSRTRRRSWPRWWRTSRETGRPSRPRLRSTTSRGTTAGVPSGSPSSRSTCPDGRGPFPSLSTRISSGASTRWPRTVPRFSPRRRAPVSARTCDERQAPGLGIFRFEDGDAVRTGCPAGVRSRPSCTRPRGRPPGRHGLERSAAVNRADGRGCPEHVRPYTHPPPPMSCEVCELQDEPGYAGLRPAPCGRAARIPRGASRVRETPRLRANCANSSDGAGLGLRFEPRFASSSSETLSNPGHAPCPAFPNRTATDLFRASTGRGMAGPGDTAGASAKGHGLGRPATMSQADGRGCPERVRA